MRVLLRIFCLFFIVAAASTAFANNLSGIVKITALADDDIGVTGVQFQLDGVNLGPEILAYPFTLNWNSSTVADGIHTISVVARDAAGNRGSSLTTIFVQNSVSTNVAAASNGATAIASSTFSSGFAAGGAINGDRKGSGWGGGGGWNDATLSAFPDWLEVDFVSPQSINEIDVFTLQDNFSSPATPFLGQTFSQY